ncbi:MAG: hypothetical protein PHE61_05645, partial [Candidatus Omnitrophica bacterium]|nr:hypothetical protein [Candidatus Omnitrophota bacterium]
NYARMPQYEIILYFDADTAKTAKDAAKTAKKWLKKLGYSEELVSWLEGRVEFRTAAQGKTKAERLSNVALSSKHYFANGVDRINYEGNIAVIADTSVFSGMEFSGIKVGVNRRAGYVCFGVLEAACLLLVCDGKPELIESYRNLPLSYGGNGIFTVIPISLSDLTETLRETFLTMSEVGMAA